MSTPSPYKVVCYGEVLWDILPDKSLPGGAPMNVAYHLQKLGTPAALITKIGLDDYGKKLVDMLSANGVTTEYFQIDYSQPTGLVYAKPNEYNEVAYDIVYPSAWDFINLDAELLDIVQNASYFVYGSLTSRNKESRETLYRLLESSVNRVLDINLRPPHFSRKHVEYLLNKADILKMNETELELITGWFSHFQNTEDRMKLIQEKFDIKTIIVTMGGDGAVINNNGAIYKHTGFKVTVADTIGSGDSFLAGFIHQSLRGATATEALEFASGIGAFIATQHGACPHYEITQITNLIHTQKNSAIKTSL